MGYLKIIFYGLLAFIERNPKFCILLLLLAIFAPFVLRWVGWLLLIIVGVALLGLAFAILATVSRGRDFAMSKID